MGFVPSNISYTISLWHRCLGKWNYLYHPRINRI